MHPFDQLMFVAKVGLLVLGSLYFSRFFMMCFLYASQELTPLW
jgi:hypothetical protein